MMMTSDPIADMLTRIRNANTAKHDTVDIPASKIKVAIAGILVDEGFIEKYDIVEAGKIKTIHVTLKYGADKNEKVITGIKRISKPGLRVYAGKDEIPSLGENVIREANQKAEEIIHRANLRGDDIIRDANELLQKASDRADEIENEANEKRMAEEREYDRVRLEVTRFKADVLNLYRSHVESLSRLPEFQKETKEAAQDAPAQDAEPAQETAAEQPAAQPDAAPAADAAAAPAEQPAETTKTTEPAAPADDDKAADSSEDFWAKDESQLKLDPPPADMKPDEPDYDAFQGVKFSE